MEFLKKAYFFFLDLMQTILLAAVTRGKLRQRRVAGTLTDAKGKSGRYTAAAAAQVAGAPFKGTGRFDDYDCTFEARRIQ